MKGGDEIDTLRRKLQRALDGGDAERAAELRARIKTAKSLRVGVDESPPECLSGATDAAGGSSVDIAEGSTGDDDSAKMKRKLARAENQGLEERAARLRQRIADAAAISKLQRKLQRAVDSGAGDERDERTRDLEARIAEATKVSLAASKSATAATEQPAEGSDELSKLRHKFARARSQGKEERAAQLKERIDAAEKNALFEKLSRKFARARERGKGERASEIRARAEAAGLILPTDGDAAEHEEMVDRQIWREHGAVDAHPAPAVTQSAADGNGAAVVADDPHAGMVLAKNGKWYAKPTPPPPGNTSLLLFYAYVQPPWTSSGRAAAIEFTRGRLEELGCGGRLRVALEGFNGTLSGPSAGIRAFCEALAAYDPRHFGNIDFKIVDGLQDSKAFRSLKVWPVDALVNYGFDAESAPLTLGGTHVSPQVWTELAAAPRTVMVDVRNANESAIGRFAPPPGGAELLDPHMRRSTEFGDWVDSNLSTLKGADKVLMVSTTSTSLRLNSRRRSHPPPSHTPCQNAVLHRWYSLRARVCAPRSERRPSRINIPA